MSDLTLGLIAKIVKSIPADDKVLVFVTKPSDLAKVTERITNDFPQIKCVALSGRDRHRMEEKMNVFRTDPTAQVLVLTPIYLTGYTFTEANHVVFMDAVHGSVTYNQGIARIDRFTQTKSAYSYNIVDGGIIKRQVL